MDCIDCHNRPTHVHLSPEEAVDGVLQLGILSRSLPYIRREGLRTVSGTYASREEAAMAIRADIESFDRVNYPELAAEQPHLVSEAAETLVEVYATIVFPAMNVAWNTYADHIGHQGMEGGCFRCHNDAFTSDDGSKISMDCEICHQILAYEQHRDQVELNIRP